MFSLKFQKDLILNQNRNIYLLNVNPFLYYLEILFSFHLQLLVKDPIVIVFKASKSILKENADSLPMCLIYLKFLKL